jgi:hypothetical protein
MNHIKKYKEFINESKEKPKWSSYEQRMVNQIIKAKERGDSLFKLPMKTQDFYRKHLDYFDKLYLK